MANILNISGTEIKDRGIQKLADYVEAHLPDEFTLVIGCKPFVYDVDAVLIGGGNIYAIECKDWKGTIKGSSYGWWQKDGQVIENPLQQARNNAAALGRWLREKLKDINGSVWVKGLLVFTHDECTINLKLDSGSNTGLHILHISALKDWINTIKGNKMSANMNDMIINSLKSYIDHSEKMEDHSTSIEIASVISIFIIGIIIVIALFNINKFAGLASLIIFLLSLPLFKKMIDADKFKVSPKSNEIRKDFDDSQLVRNFEINQFNLDEDIYYDPSMKALNCNVFHKDE
jgi:hypothetical protein